MKKLFLTLLLTTQVFAEIFTVSANGYSTGRDQEKRVLEATTEAKQRIIELAKLKCTKTLVDSDLKMFVVSNRTDWDGMFDVSVYVIQEFYCVNPENEEACRQSRSECI